MKNHYLWAQTVGWACRTFLCSLTVHVKLWTNGQSVEEAADTKSSTSANLHWPFRKQPVWPALHNTQLHNSHQLTLLYRNISNTEEQR